MTFSIYKKAKALQGLIKDVHKKASCLREFEKNFFSHHPRLLVSISKRDIFRIGKRAFTFLELMIVIAIISALAAIAIPNYKKYVKRSEYTEAIETIRMLERELLLFKLENDYYPDDLDDLGLGPINDPWGNPFGYLNIADAEGKFKGANKPRKDHNLHPINTDYDLYSMGSDGKTNIPLTAKASQDDIIRANDGSFLGYGSDY